MKIKKKLRIIVITCIAAFMLASLYPIKAKSNKVIRVGFQMMDGLSMKDKEGNYYGYDCDYLMQIAQYTGWDYEFVEVKGDSDERIMKLMDMLAKGEIDLMGDMKYIESLTTQYDYASEPYGNAYNVIAVKDDSELFDLNSVTNKKEFKIAVYKTSKRLNLLNQYAEMNGFTYEPVFCDGNEELFEKIDNKEVDAFFGVDISIPEGFHSIARFSPDPYYFVTTKGNTEIIQKLNQALTNINQINPTLPSTLYNQYFGGNSTKFVLNDNEKKYIKENPEINVLVRNGNAPIQYVVNGKYYGIGKDLLEQMSKNTGIKLKYIYSSSFEEYKEKSLSGDIDVLLGVPYDMKFADELKMNMSDPYLTSNLLLVTNKNVDPSSISEKEQAMTLYQTQKYDNNKNIKYFESNEDVLKAINNNKADYAYISNYLVTYYTNKHDLRNISTFTVPDYLRSQYAFGMSKREDLSLLSILNKTIRSQDSDIDAYIYKNAYVQRVFNLSGFVKDNFIMILLGTGILIILILCIVHAYYTKQLKMKKAVELEYMRYQKLSDISGEMMFSYDYQKDELKVSNSGIGKISEKEVTESFFKHSSKDEEHEFIKTIHYYLSEKKDVNFELEAKLRNCEKRWYQVSVKIISDIEKDKEKAIYAVGKVIDIQKKREEREELLIKSQTDILTGILNRGGAEDYISEALENEIGIGALVMIDLDNFKEVNDNYGHMEGDNTLLETAQLLKSVFSSNIVARLGGDEFLIYLSDTNEEEVVERCKKALVQIRNLPCTSSKSFVLTMSMGVVFTSYSKAYRTLMEKADEMMYEVKRQGRDSFTVYQK